ncbi:MAG TPA: hypothetical protein VJ999_02475, partial [Candidatus Sulfotelmatobacter sp.]|nr:hypothetical protein [Candidatus Sulfotelmatobacter sp.]
PACRRAIFRRTEFDPISTAANVGMGSPTVYMSRIMRLRRIRAAAIIGKNAADFNTFVTTVCYG